MCERLVFKSIIWIILISGVLFLISCSSGSNRNTENFNWSTQYNHTAVAFGSISNFTSIKNGNQQAFLVLSGTTGLNIINPNTYVNGNTMARSADIGQSWSSLYQPLGARFISSSASWQKMGQQIVFMYGRDLLAESIVFGYSIDQGVNWVQTSNPPLASTTSMTTTTESGMPVVIISGYEGIAISANKGDTWSTIESVVTNISAVYALESQFGTMLFVATNNGSFYKSNDLGETFESLTSPTSTDTINAIYSIIESGKVILLAGGDGGLYASSDMGSSWSASTNTGVTNITAISSFESDDKTILVTAGVGGINGNLAISSNLTTWGPLFNTLGYSILGAMPITGFQYQNSLISMAGASIFGVSSNMGESWAIISLSAMPQLQITGLSAFNSDNIFAGMILNESAADRVFVKFSYPNIESSMVTLTYPCDESGVGGSVSIITYLIAESASRVTAGCTIFSFESADKGYIRTSNDSGQTWSVASNPGVGQFVTTLAIAKSADIVNRIFVGGIGTSGSLDNALVAKLTYSDDGATWHSINFVPADISPEGIMIANLSTSQSDANTYLWLSCLDILTGFNYVFLSRDLGKTWINTSFPQNTGLVRFINDNGKLNFITAINQFTAMVAN